ncbi:serine hydrolase domain-containing protein [Clostridium massiliamazoniense]|uniref:serine hydrolase domain-containing protein n=1 Tax=Clostridium massiliamazoniense TaxID=1347366 RepID=UPI0006D7BCE0|nr:serine hydrolase domain-containing protein [Clostridium massiliamazoniense]
MITKIEKAMGKFKNFNGVVKICYDDKPIFEKAYGYSDKENKIKNTVDTKFLTCSITKIFTALSIMKLYEEELLDIEDPAVRYLNDININCIVKIKDLLAHKSGINDFIMCRNEIDLYKDLYPKELLEFILKKEGRFYPGENTLYSNTGYLILTLIIEKVTGRFYEDYIKENFFTPLEMNQSSFYGDNNDMAIGYINKRKVALFSSTVFYGSGNIISTVNDLWKFMSAVKSYKIVSRETLELMTEVHGYTGLYKYGYGFLLNDNFREKSIGHSGTYPVGYSTIINSYENSKITIIVLSNDIKPIKLFIPGVANASFIEGTIMEEITGMKLNKIFKCM